MEPELYCNIRGKQKSGRSGLLSILAYQSVSGRNADLGSVLPLGECNMKFVIQDKLFCTDRLINCVYIENIKI